MIRCFEECLIELNLNLPNMSQAIWIVSKDIAYKITGVID